MKGYPILMILALVFCAQLGFAQVSEKTYEITITLTDNEGEKEVKEMIIKGDMSQEELDALIQEHIGGADGEVDVNVNVNVNDGVANETNGKESKTITKIIKQRNNQSEEEKIIIEEHDMEIEVKGDKVFINGEEVKDGEFGDKKVRILKFEEGEEFDLENLLDGENIEIGEGEKIFFIEREESSEGIALLGVYTRSTPGVEGLRIIGIIEGTPAEKMGLLKGDIIMSIDGKEIDNTKNLNKVVKTYLPGEIVKLIFKRDGNMIVRDIKLSDYNEYMAASTKAWKEKGHHRPHTRHSRKWVEDNKPSLGVILIEQDSDEVIIDEVLKGSAAEKIGLQAGDKIIKIDKAEVLDIDHAIATIKGHEIGDEIKLKIDRGGKKKSFRATLQKPIRRSGGYENNTSNTIERIIIKKTEDEDRADFETSGVFRLSDFDLSPNPSAGDINVKFNMDPLQPGEILNVRILSLEGKVIRESVMDSFDGVYNEAFDLGNVPSGIYLFQVGKNKQKFTKRFVLKKN